MSGTIVLMAHQIVIRMPKTTVPGITIHRSMAEKMAKAEKANSMNQAIKAAVDMAATSIRYMVSHLAMQVTNRHQRSQWIRTHLQVSNLIWSFVFMGQNLIAQFVFQPIRSPPIIHQHQELRHDKCSRRTINHWIMVMPSMCSHHARSINILAHQCLRHM